MTTSTRSRSDARRRGRPRRGWRLVRRTVQVLLPIAAIALVPLALPDETTGGQGYGTGPDRLNVSVAEAGAPGTSQPAAARADR